MQERSVYHGSQEDGMIGSVRAEQHYDLVVRPTPCDCGEPPPVFRLPPPPVDPAWAEPGTDLCDIVAPYQTCRGLTEVAAEEGFQSSPSLSMLAALITTSLFLFIVLLAGTIFFYKHRRRLGGLAANKSAGTRGETSRMLYDDLACRPHIIPSNLRQNGPHIEMVAVKGECMRLVPCSPPVPGGLLVYPPPPSLTDDGSERISNMYEEIPYYACRPVPSVSYNSDSDDDVSRPSDDSLRHHAYLPVASDDGGDARYVRTLPPGRRRPSPVSPVPRLGRTTPARRDESQRRKDPYYYSDILARDAADGTSDGISADDGYEQYRRPYCDRRPAEPWTRHCRTDGAAGDLGSPAGRPRDGHVTPLANRMALDPYMYPSERPRAHRPRHKQSSSFRDSQRRELPDRDGYVTSRGKSSPRRGDDDDPRLCRTEWGQSGQ